MLAVTAEPFDSPAYLFELKWDGLRALAFLNGGTRLQSRNLREISAQYPELAFLHRQVKKAGTILDGEIIALADGKPSFQRLTSRIHLTSRRDPPGMRETPCFTSPLTCSIMTAVLPAGNPARKGRNCRPWSTPATPCSSVPACRNRDENSSNWLPNKA